MPKSPEGTGIAEAEVATMVFVHVRIDRACLSPSATLKALVPHESPQETF